ncbi:MAG: hypothetical protein ACI4JM_00365 [Oscillospiraceae bacterium]
MNRKDIDTMLEKLSHSDMNYAKKTEIKPALPKNEDNVVSGVEIMVKRNIFIRTAAACIFSVAVVSGAMIYSRYYSNSVASPSETAETNIIHQNTMIETEIVNQNNVELPDIQIPDRMSFKALFYDDENKCDYFFESKSDYINYSIEGIYDGYSDTLIYSCAKEFDFEDRKDYIEPEDRFYIESKEKCSEIIEILRKNCREALKSDYISNGYVEIWGKCGSTNEFPYVYTNEDGENGDYSAPNQIVFQISDDMEIIVMSAGKPSYLTIKQKEEVKYYMLEPDTFSEIADIVLESTEEVRNSIDESREKIKERISCRLFDESSGNEIEAEYELNRISDSIFEFSIHSINAQYTDKDLKNGFYTPCNVSFSFFDEYGNEIEIQNENDTYDAEGGVCDYNRIVMGVQAEASEPFEWTAMRVRVEDIIYTDSYTNEKDENYVIPITLELEYNNAYKAENEEATEDEAPIMPTSDKEDIASRMLNADDYFDSAEGNMITNELSADGTNVYFCVSDDFSYGYEENNGEMYYESLYDAEKGITAEYYNDKKLFEIDNTGFVKNEDDNFYRVPFSARISTDSDGINCYYYGDRTRIPRSAKECLSSQELCFGLLKDFDLWEITGETEFLGYPVVIIEGKTDGEYLSSTNFMFYIEKNTGIVMKFESYNASGNVVHYTEIKDITINQNVTKNKGELEKYLNEKSKDYDDAEKLRKEQAASE